MMVADHGRGFSPIEPMPPGSPSKGFGLPGIGERLTLVSGAFEVEQALGQGCTLHIRRPL